MTLNPKCHNRIDNPQQLQRNICPHLSAGLVLSGCHNWGMGVKGRGQTIVPFFKGGGGDTGFVWLHLQPIAARVPKSIRKCCQGTNPNECTFGTDFVSIAKFCRSKADARCDCICTCLCCQETCFGALHTVSWTIALIALLPKLC